MDHLQFFNPYEDIRLTANRLPHWQQKGAVYFVSFRLADAVPNYLRTQWSLNVRRGCAFIHNHGLSKPSVNITIDFQAHSNAGWMPGTAPAF